MNAGFLSTGACYVTNSSCAFGHLFLLSHSFSCRLYVAHAFSYIGTEICCHFFILKHNALGSVKSFLYISIYIFGLIHGGCVLRPSVPKTHDYMPQNFTLLKDGIKQYVIQNMQIQRINPVLMFL